MQNDHTTKGKAQNYKTPRWQHKINLDDFSYDCFLFNTTPKSWCIKETIGKLDFIKIKRFGSMKDKDKRMIKTSHKLEECI